MNRTRYIFDNVLGKEFSLVYIAAESWISWETLAAIEKKEWKMLDFIKEYIWELGPMDDEQLEYKLFTVHPWYAENPELTKEEVLRIMKS